MTSVVVAIPTLRNDDALEACLRALDRQTYADFRVIVVDNGDNPGARAVSAETIAPGRNVGFGAAVNLAIAASDAPFIAVLNDDTEPDAGWLAALVARMEADFRLGMCASNIRLAGSGLRDSAGMSICFDGSSRQRGHRAPAGSFAASEDVLMPSACAALYRRQMLDEIGLFDEDFFLYCEDTDLGLRARWAGWDCAYVAEAGVQHRYSHSAGAFSPLKARYVERNRLWVAIKNFPLRLLIGAPAVHLARCLWQIRAASKGEGAAAQFLRSGQSRGTAGAIIAKAHWDTLLHLPALLRKRAEMRRRRKLTAREFSQLMRRHRIPAKELAHA